MAAEGVTVLAPWLRLLLFLGLLLRYPLAMCAPCPRGCSCPGVREVHCTFRHLTSAPRNLPKDTERVNLGYNSLQAVQGSEFTNLLHLEMLMLHGNDITTVSPGAFYSLRSLQILKLSYNKLKAVTPSMFEGLVSLVRLHLDHNNIDFIEPYTFSGLMSLKLLQLEGNKLRDLHPHSFVTLSLLGSFWSSGLRHLHLSDNQLHYLQPRTLQALSKLELLSLHGNPWTCDCHLQWLLEWNRKHDGVIKCKKERDAASSENCVACSSPRPLNGSQVLSLSASQLACERPSLVSHLKKWHSPGWDDIDSEPDMPYTRDLERPLGHLTFILTDSHGNTAHVACDVRRPSESSSVTWENTRTPGELAVNVSLVTHLECEVDRDVLQNLWKLVAYYYESPAILERGVRRENTSRVTFQYSQAQNDESPYFTDLKGQLMAEPAWLLQPRVTLQLNRRQTTTKKLVLDFTAFISKHISGRGEQEDVPSSWALIRRGSPGRVQSVLEGSEVSLGCTVISSEEQRVEWMMPDLSVLEESNSHFEVSEDGKLFIGNTSVSDAGLYHCLVRTKHDVDLVSVRLTVKERLLSPNSLNGKKMEVEIGETLSLPCYVTSTQPSETRWYVPQNLILLPSQPRGRLFVNQNGTLVITKTTHEDAGEYSCLATNLYGVDMLAHLVVVTGEEHADAKDKAETKSPGVKTAGGETPLFGNEDSEGSGFQEIKRSYGTQAPKRVGGKQRYSGVVLRPGMKVKRIKDTKRKLNKSVKVLDPNRWAEILAKANSKTPTAPPTTQPATTPTTITATTMTRITTVTTLKPQTTTTITRKTTTARTITTTSTKPIESHSKTKSQSQHTEGESDLSEKQPGPLQPPPTKHVKQAPRLKEPPVNSGKGDPNTDSGSVINLSVTESPQSVTQPVRIENKHVGKEPKRVNQKNNHVWTNRQRPPKRRGRPPQRPIRPLNPSIPPSQKPQTKLPLPTTVEKYESTALHNDNSKMEDNVTEQIPLILPQTDNVHVTPYFGPGGGIKISDSINTKLLTSDAKDNSRFAFSNEMYVPVSETITSPKPRFAPPPTKVPKQERTLANTKKQDAIRQTTYNRQTFQNIATTTKPSPINYDINIQPPLSHDTVTMSTAVLNKLVLDKGAAKPKDSLTNIHITKQPPKKSEERTVTHIRTTVAQKNVLRNTYSNSDTNEKNHSQMKPDSLLPNHPWIHQQTAHKKVQTTPPPSSPNPDWPYNRFQLLPSVHGSGRYPAFTRRPWMFPQLGVRGYGVTNRPEITAETVRPSAFISSPDSGTDAPLTSHINSRGPGSSSRKKQQDLLTLSKLRNRYRQVQLDRISKLALRVTPKPKITQPTPRPHHQPPTPSYIYRPGHPTMAPLIPTNRPYSTAGELFGSRWHHSHWVPKRLSTALPSPSLKGNGVKPRITSVNTVSVSALAERDVVLHCEASGDPQPALSWTKVSTGATIQANTKHGQRFEVLKNGTFVIRNVQLQDRGQYLCTALNKFGSDRMVITVAVQTQPPKIIGSQSTEISVYLGNPVSLDCIALGKPQAQISWILPDRTFVRDVGALDRSATLLPNGTLRIQSANFSSKGDYKCIASNAAGADTVTYHIHVAALPPAINEEPSESIVIPAGRSVSLHCTAKAEPAPVLKWALPAGAHVKPSQFLGRRVFVFPNGTLYIKNLSPADTGRYDCSVTNAFGAARRVLHLEVRQEAPSLQQSHHPSQQHVVTAMYGSTVYLHCPENSGSPRGTLWQLPSKRLLEHRSSPERPVTVFSNGTLRILQLTEKDEGNYLCMFQRPNGEDLELFQVEVLMTPPKIKHLGTAQKRVTYGENVQVDCVASGLPDPEVSWSLPDGTLINNALQSDDSGARSRRYVMFGNGTLLLHQMGKKDEGDYTCHAKNELGEDEKKVSVKVGQDFPRITSKSQLFLRARLGESAYMACQATGEPPPTILWLSPNNDVITSSTKYQILDNGTLVIEMVTLADQGKYACVARNSAGDDIKNMKLEVEAREPHINKQRGRGSIKVLAVSYQTTLLDCRAEGKPEPLISWTTPYNLSLPTPYLGGRFQVHSNGSLELRGVRKSDEGRYVCLAKNHLGEASLAIDLEVASIAEKPSFAMPNIEILPIKQDGSDLTLQCSAHGKPNPDFVWILPNGTMLTPGARLHRFIHYPGNGTMHITQLGTMDKGVYRCLAKNVAGTAEKRYNLEPGKKPVIRGTTGNMKITFGQMLNLQCIVDGWPQATITWTLPNGLVLDKPQVFGRMTFLSNGTLQLSEVATFDRGTYICKATNTFGSSILSYPVAVTVYPPRITNSPPSITRVHRGSPVTLNCIAAGIPKPEITWTLPGRTTLVPNNRFAAQGGIHMTVEGNLVILDPVLMNSGIYKCNAKNPLGSDFKATYLQVI
ncbi:hypothetical protein UPYG_G00213460 [Umbra pygmaea]|uniref:Ig-like domain-containing protein n=1 Tax=Umbra pygmaea TaxID=75934 RepID=A0ABD0WKR5_UMBPY